MQTRNVLSVSFTTKSGKVPMKTLSLNITQDTINRSKCSNPNSCMVAEAVAEKYHEAKTIYVDNSVIRFTLDGVRYYFTPPRAVKEHIADFDNDKTAVRPFKFVTSELQRCRLAGYNAEHPNSLNAKRPCKNFGVHPKKKIATRVRINGVCRMIPFTES